MAGLERQVMGLQNHTPSSQVSRLTLALDGRFECEMGSPRVGRAISMGSHAVVRSRRLNA